MTTKNEETKVTTKRTNPIIGKIMNLMAFVAVCIGGVSLFLAMALGWFGLTASWVSSLKTIANAIGWLALCLLSIKYILHRRRLWIWIVWVVAVVMIFSGIIIPLFA